MNEISEALTRWLEQTRHRERASAAVISVLALGSGTAVYLLASLLIYAALSVVCVALVRSVRLLVPIALAVTGGIFVLCMQARDDERQLGLDPMGFWILKDICSVGPRLILEGLRQVRRCGQLGEMDVAACARALAYLAAHNAAVTWQELTRHCAQLPSPLLREQLSLVNGVLFLGDDADKVTLMDPFRMRLRWMLGTEQRTWNEQEPARPRPEPAGRAVPVNEPEKLSAYEILGLSASASMVEIKAAYRKRVKECHPDLFAGMDEQAKALAESWTKALNAAYASLKARPAKPNSMGQR